MRSTGAQPGSLLRRPRHEALADRFFADPHHSAEGWERAVDAQHRVVTALADVHLAPSGDPSDDDPGTAIPRT